MKTKQSPITLHAIETENGEKRRGRLIRFSTAQESLAAVRGRFGLIDIHAMTIIKIARKNVHSKNNMENEHFALVIYFIGEKSVSLGAMTTPTTSESVVRAPRTAASMTVEVTSNRFDATVPFLHRRNAICSNFSVCPITDRSGGK